MHYFNVHFNVLSYSHGGTKLPKFQQSRNSVFIELYLKYFSNNVSTDIFIYLCKQAVIHCPGYAILLPELRKGTQSKLDLKHFSQRIPSALYQEGHSLKSFLHSRKEKKPEGRPRIPCGTEAVTRLFSARRRTFPCRVVSQLGAVGKVMSQLSADFLIELFLKLMMFML